MFYKQLMPLTVIVALVLSFCFVAALPALAQDEEHYFTTTIIVPINNPTRMHYAYVITKELPKIGIRTELILVEWDELSQYLTSPTYADYSDGGFDTFLIGWTGSLIPSGPLTPFHSSQSQSTPGTWANNYYPVLNDTLDGLIELTRNTTDFTLRKEYFRQVLELLVWDIHPAAGIYQWENVFYMQDNILSFDPERFPAIEEIYFRDGHSAGHGQVNELIVASRYYPDNHVPFWSQYVIWKPAFAGLLERDTSLSFVPSIAKTLPYPVAVKNNYSGITSSTDPNTATVWEIELREDVFWHEGYGYRMSDTTHREILNFDADDVVWFYKNLIQDNLPISLGLNLEWGYKDHEFAFGTEPDKAIVKINQFKVQFHLANVYADLFSLFDIVLPQHILDPTYNALGLGAGVRADGTTAPSYVDWITDDYNLGYRTSGDTERPATIGNGAYMLYPGKNDIEQTLTMTNWTYYFKNNDAYWRSRVYLRPEKYIYTWMENEANMKLALENRDIDILDTHCVPVRDYLVLKDKPGITAVKKLDWGYQTIGYNILHGAADHLANKWVRLAISHMIPRQKIIDYLLVGLGQPSFVPFPQQSLYWPEDLEPIVYNQTKAEEYMRKAGYGVEETSTWQPTIPTSGFEVLTFFIAMSGIATTILIYRRRKH